MPHPHKNSHPTRDQCQDNEGFGDDSTSLEATFQKMEKLGIPADIFGNINPQWRIVMRSHFEGEKQIDQKMEEQFEKSINKIEKHCQTKYGSDQEKLQDCHDQAHYHIMNQFQKPKQLSEILLCNFANKCLIRGNTVDFCTEEVIKQKKVINAECLKKLQGIEQFL